VNGVKKIELVELDAAAAGLLGADPHEIEYLGLASETFSAWDENTFKEALGRGFKLFTLGR
jgi:hypothetical protein